MMLKTIITLRKICRKYRIPFDDLPGVLEEYIAYDNDDYWWECMTEKHMMKLRLKGYVPRKTIIRFLEMIPVQSFRPYIPRCCDCVHAWFRCNSTRTAARRRRWWHPSWTFRIFPTWRWWPTTSAARQSPSRGRLSREHEAQPVRRADGIQIRPYPL